MNEDIKIVKNLLQMLENGFLTEEMCPIPSWNPEQNYASALAHILSDYEANKIKVQELEEENYNQRKQLNDAFVRGFIHKDKVKEALEYIEYYFDRLNGPDEDMNYIRKIKKELLGGDESDGT